MFVPRQGPQHRGKGPTGPKLVAIASDPRSLDAFARTVTVSARVDGKAAVLSPDEVNATHPVRFWEVRRPAVDTKIQRYTRLVAVEWDGGANYHVWAESGIEGTACQHLNVDPDVDLFVTQPVVFEWELGGTYTWHVPDILVQHVDGARTLVNVKTERALTDPETLARMAIAERTAHLLGWGYEIRTEPSEQWLLNFRHCLGARHRVTDLDRRQLRHALTGIAAPCTWGELSDRLGGDARAEWLVMYAVEVGLVHIDLDEPIDERTPLLPAPLPQQWIRRSDPAVPMHVGAATAHRKFTEEPRTRRRAQPVMPKTAAGRRAARADSPLTRPGPSRPPTRPRQTRMALAPGRAWTVDGHEHRMMSYKRDGADILVVLDIDGETVERPLLDVQQQLFDLEIGQPTISATPIHGTARYRSLLPKQRTQIAELVMHLNEANCGDPWGSPAGANNAPQRAEYDPAKYKYKKDRFGFKAKELARAGYGRGYSSTSLQNKYNDYAVNGIDVLIPAKWLNEDDPTVGIDDEFLDAAIAFVDLTVAEGTTRASTRRNKFREYLRHADIDEDDWPADDRMRRILERFEMARRLDGPHKARKNTESRPSQPHRTFAVTRPGQVLQIDATNGNAFAWQNGVWLNFEVLSAVDLWDSTPVGLRTTPMGHCSRDLRLLMFDIMRPVVRRTGWTTPKPFWRGIPEAIVVHADAVTYPHGVTFEPAQEVELVTPHDTYKTTLMRAEYPTSIVLDHGKPETSIQFLSLCAELGIEVLFAPPGRGSMKGHIESWNRRIADLMEYLPGYKGASVAERGEHSEVDARFTIAEIEQNLHEFVFCVHNKSRSRANVEPSNPKLKLSPDERFGLYLDYGGYMDVPKEAARAYEFLETFRAAIEDDGVHHGFRYDDRETWPMWRRKLTQGDNGEQETFFYDRYDLSRIYWRDRSTNQWHIIPMRSHTGAAREPMSNLRTRHALRLAQDYDRNSLNTNAREHALDELNQRWSRHVFIDDREAAIAVRDQARVEISAKDWEEIDAMLAAHDHTAPLFTETPDDHVRQLTDTGDRDYDVEDLPLGYNR